MMINKIMMAGGLAVALLTGGAQAQVIGGDITVDGSRDDVIFFGGDINVSGDVDGSVSGIAGSARIDANITGDVEFFGGDAQLRGTIAGDVDMAGGSLRVEANVGEDLSVAGGDVEVSGEIGGELNAAGGSVVLDVIVRDGAHIGGGYVLLPQSSEFYGRMEIAAGEIEFLGTARDDVKIEAETAIVGGRFEGDVDITAERVRVLADAVVVGEIRVRGPNEPDVEAGADIATLDYAYQSYNFGAEDWEDIDIHIDGPLELIGAPFEFLGGIFLGVAFLLGFFASLIAPRGVTSITRSFRKRPFSAFFVGIVAFPVSLILMVVVTVVLAITVIGIPLILLIWPLYPWLLFLAFAFGGVVIGDLIFNRNRPNEGLGLAMRALSLLVVMAALAVVGQIEGLGFLLGWFVWVIGMGAWVLSFGERHSQGDGLDDRAEQRPERDRDEDIGSSRSDAADSSDSSAGNSGGGFGGDGGGE